MRLSQLLWEAEGIIEQLEDPIQKVATPLPANAYPVEILATLPVNNRINLVIIEPGEVFLKHVVIPLAGDDLADHAAIVNRKLALYSEHPGATVVECACINFYSYILNEPHVRVPASRLSQIIW